MYGLTTNFSLLITQRLNQKVTDYQHIFYPTNEELLDHIHEFLKNKMNHTWHVHYPNATFIDENLTLEAITRWDNKINKADYVLDTVVRADLLKGKPKGYVPLNDTGKVDLSYIDPKNMAPIASIFNLEKEEYFNTFGNFHDSSLVKPFDVVRLGKDNEPLKGFAYITKTINPWESNPIFSVIAVKDKEHFMDQSDQDSTTFLGIEPPFSNNGKKIDEMVSFAHKHETSDGVSNKDALDKISYKDGALMFDNDKIILYKDNLTFMDTIHSKIDYSGHSNTTLKSYTIPFPNSYDLIDKNSREIVRVFYNGLLLQKDIDYTISDTDGKTITLMNDKVFSNKDTITVDYMRRPPKFSVIDHKKIPFYGLAYTGTESGTTFKYIDINGNEIQYSDIYPINRCKLLKHTSNIGDIGEFFGFNTGYIKTWIGKQGTPIEGYRCIAISPLELDGFVRHPAFYNYDTGEKANSFYVSRYNMCNSNDGEYPCSCDGCTINREKGSIQKQKINDLNTKHIKHFTDYIGRASVHMINFYEYNWLGLVLLLTSSNPNNFHEAYGAIPSSDKPCPTIAGTPTSSNHIIQKFGYMHNLYSGLFTRLDGIKVVDKKLVAPEPGTGIHNRQYITLVEDSITLDTSDPVNKIYPNPYYDGQVTGYAGNEGNGKRLNGIDLYSFFLTKGQTKADPDGQAGTEYDLNKSVIRGASTIIADLPDGTEDDYIYAGRSNTAENWFNTGYGSPFMFSRPISSTIEDVSTRLCAYIK